MRSFSIPTFAGALCLSAVLVWQAPAPADDDVPPPPPAQNDVVTQARGPVHEAYAEPAETAPEAGPIIAKQPPDPIAEQPPDQKPAGDNIEWVPGYWAWDDDATDFTWISGFWRNPPPGRDWTPGHWQQVEGGWQWVAGSWAPQNVQQVEYLPPPPPSIDNGPSTPATDAATVYVPGCWVYRETRYLWRPGYWMAANPNWVWIPDHYVWTPVGYVFVGGYWDRPLEGRGLLFAPVRFNRGVYLAQGFVYTPQYVVQPDFLLGALFVRPTYTSYYFGDYFEARYEKRGFTSWIDYRVGRFSYDPNFAYYRWRYRADDHWVSSLRELYALRRSGEVPRPPRTFVQQTQIVNKITVNNTENVTINKNIHITNIQNVTALTPLNKVQSVRITGLAGLTGAKPEGRPIPAPKVITLEPVSKERQAEVKQRVAELHQFAVRQQQEQAKVLATGAIPVKPTDKPRAVKVDLPGNPARPSTPRPEPKGPVEAPPPQPTTPRHEERPIPPRETPKPSAPPREPTPREPQPPTREPVKEPPMPPRRELPPQVKEPPAPVKEPPMPPRREPPPAVKEPPAPVKEPPMPPRREPPPAVKEPPAPVKEPPMPPRREPPPQVKTPTPPPAKEPPAREPPPKDKPPLTNGIR